MFINKECQTDTLAFSLSAFSLLNADNEKAGLLWNFWEISQKCALDIIQMLSQIKNNNQTWNFTNVSQYNEILFFNSMLTLGTFFKY